MRLHGWGSTDALRRPGQPSACPDAALWFSLWLLTRGGTQARGSSSGRTGHSPSRQLCADPVAGIPSWCLVLFCSLHLNLCMPPRRAAGSRLRAEAHAEAAPCSAPAALAVGAGCRSTRGARHCCRDPFKGPARREPHTTAAWGKGGSVALMGAVPRTSPNPAAATMKVPV